MDAWITIGWAFGLSLAYMTVVWLLSLPLRNASIVDSFWGPGFLLLAAILPSISGGLDWRSWLVLALTTVWAVRLSVHITVRNWGKGEDRRYAAWRERAGGRFWWTSYFRVFAVQAGALVVVAAPILVVAASQGPSRWTAWDIVGAIVWAIGLSFEAIADAQLQRFRRDPSNQGRVLDRGLWRISRHPNYFGEALLWWGMFLVAMAVPYGYCAIVGPAAITFLLVRVSGVRLLEKDLVARSPAYVDYVRRTSAFIPRPPRRTA